MESIYFVLSWLCHRKCSHCYEDRFQPYHGEDLERVVTEARSNVPRIIDHLPPRMTYLDRANAGAGTGARPIDKRGRIILAGGEILLEQVRESVLYPALEQLHLRYASAGGVELIVQTTGDLLNERLIRELLERRVSVISVSGLDAFHVGLEEESARERLQLKLTRWFENSGMQPWVPPPQRNGDGAYFHFFGATPDSWIGSLWPRGRAAANELSTATLEDNFCNRWSGGLNFLERRYAGSEVAIEPSGNVFPCCLKTKKPLGSLLSEDLESILDRLTGNPVYEAISAGRPERMGLTHGWSEQDFIRRSLIRLPSGRSYQNLCIGCDAFHDEVLSGSLQGPLVTLSPTAPQ